MGSGCYKFKEGEADKRARVGREEEGTSSNRPELLDIVLALQSAALKFRCQVNRCIFVTEHSLSWTLKGTKQSGTGIANHSEKAKTVFAFENKYFRFVYHISPGD